ncbi:MAG TPA: hypothetical protein VMP03_13560 [Methylomirabilota bacterium]|nr:hypothetical protein [Methylomirabilota bacterium]
MTDAAAPSDTATQAEWRWLGRTATNLAIVALPVTVGFVCTMRALMEFAYGGQIYGAGGQPWAFGEWMISYASGFVRRGLTGEILIPLAHLFGSPAIPFLLVTVACAVLIGLTLVYRYAPVARTEAVLMLFLPASVLFPLWDYNVVGRKEQLVLALCAVLALAGRRGAAPGDGVKGSLVVGLVAAAMMLLHEGLLFFLPLMFALLEMGRPPGSLGAAAMRFSAMLGPPTLVFAAIALASGPIDTAPLFQAVPEYGPGMQAWCAARGIGSICWLGFPTSFVVGYVYNIGFEGFLRAACLIVLQGWLVTALFLRIRGGVADRRTMALLAIGWGGLAPLFFIAFDWGRWIAAATMMFVILAPLRPDLPRRPLAVLVLGAAILSVFTVGHLQSQSFEIGGPRLAKSLIESAATAIAP